MERLLFLYVPPKIEQLSSQLDTGNSFTVCNFPGNCARHFIPNRCFCSVLNPPIVNFKHRLNCLYPSASRSPMIKWVSGPAVKTLMSILTHPFISLIGTCPISATQPRHSGFRKNLQHWALGWLTYFLSAYLTFLRVFILSLQSAFYTAMWDFPIPQPKRHWRSQATVQKKASGRDISNT